MKALVIAMCAALALVLGCSDDDENCVNCPRTIPDPTIQNIWPNADKTSWTYTYTARMWSGGPTIFPNEDDVPATPLPSWTEIHDLVQSHIPVEPFTTTQGVFRMQFDGMVTTAFDVTAQNLKTELFLQTGSALEPRNATDGEVILHQISTVGERYGSDGFEQVPSFPTFVHGGPWEKTSEHIGTYNDLEARLAWEFLTDKLSVGSDFKYQVLPTFTDHVFLYGFVDGQSVVETEAGTFEKGLVFLYILDHGTTAVTDINGDVIGYMRTLDYGSVVYVPSVGPVFSYERAGVEPGNPPSDGVMDITLSLIGSSTLGK